MADGIKFSTVTIRRAVAEDYDAIQKLFDLTIRKDVFEPRGRLISKLRKCATYVAVMGGEKVLVGFAINETGRILIHLLVHPDYRGYGIGKKLLREANPVVIRSKSDQSTGDPKEFYLSNGYHDLCVPKVGRKKNIELLERTD
jgi:GNAT superfamily N-acetyltransferase